MRKLLMILFLAVPVSLYGEECTPGGPGVHRGDVNCSGGEPNMSDVIYLVEFTTNQGPAPCCFDSADVNLSGFIDTQDVVHLVAYLYQGCFRCLALPHCSCPL